MKLRELLKKSKLLYKIGHNINERRYKREEKRQNNAMHKYGYEACSKVEEVIHNIKHSVFYGTLLGFVREGGFIAHDCDLDFAILEKNFDWQILHHQLNERGFKFGRAFKVGIEVMEVSYIYKGLHVDFFILFEKDGLKSYSFYKQESVKYENDFEYSIKMANFPNIEELIEHNVKNIVVKIPKNYDEVLTSTYGENWRIPNPKWSFTDSKSIFIEKKGELVREESEFLKLIQDRKIV